MLSEEQKEQIRKWVADGAGISEVQKRIGEDFGVSMTYMDVRFLLIDLNASVQSKPDPEEKKTAAPIEEQPELGGAEPAGDFDADEASSPAEDPAAAIGGGVSVTLDRVVRAGALASGDVTFSDGVTGSWFVDRMGRLSLTKVSKEAYQPTQEDLRSFQMELQRKLGGM